MSGNRGTAVLLRQQAGKAPRERCAAITGREGVSHGASWCLVRCLAYSKGPVNVACMGGWTDGWREVGERAGRKKREK